MDNSNKIILLLVTATVGILGVYTFQDAIASHSFEAGAPAGTLPVATTVLLAGQVMQPNDYLPIADFSPNFVSGHYLLRIPCTADMIPRVVPVAGHADEIAQRSYIAPAQLNLVHALSTAGKTCVYHSHIPAVDIDAVGAPGAPRVTDIGLLNTCSKNVVFRTANAASFTILQVLGDINAAPYGPEGTLPAPFNGPDFKVNIPDELIVDVGHGEPIQGDPCSGASPAHDDGGGDGHDHG